MRHSFRLHPSKTYASGRGALRRLVVLLCGFCSVAYAIELDSVTAGLRNRYASVETVTGHFQQVYRAPGIEQRESGVFYLKKPALMRWEYNSPIEKLFIADGRRFFYYVPRDRQVQVQSFSAAALHNTPLEFLFGAGDIGKKFAVSWETEYRAKADDTCLIRLVPRSPDSEYDFFVLEIDRATWDLEGILIREAGGSVQEFLFTKMAVNQKIDEGKFRFSPPKGSEVVKLDEN